MRTVATLVSQKGAIGMLSLPERLRSGLLLGRFAVLIK